MPVWLRLWSVIGGVAVLAFRSAAIAARRWSALLLYGSRSGGSSWRLERRCLEDVAARVVCANERPDHATIARFRQRHEAALTGLIGEVLALCAEAGLGRATRPAVAGRP